MGRLRSPSAWVRRFGQELGKLWQESREVSVHGSILTEGGRWAS